MTRRLVLTLLGVVTLHAIWDQSQGWAVMLTNGLISNEGWHLLWPNAQFWIIPPTGEELLWFNVFYNALLWTTALVGITWLVVTWRHYGAREQQATPTPATFA